MQYRGWLLLWDIKTPFLLDFFSVHFKAKWSHFPNIDSLLSLKFRCTGLKALTTAQNRKWDDCMDGNSVSYSDWNQPCFSHEKWIFIASLKIAKNGLWSLCWQKQTIMNALSRGHALMYTVENLLITTEILFDSLLQKIIFIKAYVKLTLVVRIKVTLPLRDICSVSFSITWLGDALQMQGAL